MTKYPICACFVIPDLSTCLCCLSRYDRNHQVCQTGAHRPGDVQKGKETEEQAGGRSEPPRRHGADVGQQLLDAQMIKCDGIGTPNSIGEGRKQMLALLNDKCWFSTMLLLAPF